MKFQDCFPFILGLGFTTGYDWDHKTVSCYTNVFACLPDFRHENALGLLSTKIQILNVYSFLTVHHSVEIQVLGIIKELK